MRYLLGGLFHQNKFPVKLLGPKSVYSLATCVLLFNRCVCLVLFISSASHPHPLCRSRRSQMFFKIGLPKILQILQEITGAFFLQKTSGGSFYLFCFSWIFLLLLLPCCTPTTSLRCCYFLRFKKHFCLFITTTTSLLS